MKHAFSLIGLIAVLMVLAGSGLGQADDMCREFGTVPSLDSPFAQVPYVFGRVTITGVEAGRKPPKVTIALVTAQNSHNRITIEASGNYCFRRSGSGGTLIIEIDGVETARRSLPGLGPAQQREDFEIQAAGISRVPPAVLSAKFSHPRNEKTTELYKKAGEAQAAKDAAKTVSILNKIVAADPADFIAWAQLGSLYFEQASFAEADAAFRKSLELKQEYVPAWINVGKMRLAQKQVEAAIEIFKHAASLDPKNARVRQLLGEAYLQAKMGTLGVEALNEAIRLDPIGMAECHLLIARLYDLAGAKRMAAKEYRMFLEKVPNHAEKDKIEKYLKDNPE